MVASHSTIMNLNNGIHDSLAGDFIKDSRRMVRSGAATPEGIGVAAIRAGWPPRNIRALVQKVDVS